MMDYGDEHHERPTVIRCYPCGRERPYEGDGTLWYAVFAVDLGHCIHQCGRCTMRASLTLPAVTKDTIDPRFYSFMN